MISYLSSGVRDYCKKPIRPYCRWSWEIFAVRSGAVALWLRDRVLPAEERTLWVFPPGYQHGWQGLPGEKAEVTIFLVDNLPDPVGQWVVEQNWLKSPLTPLMERRFKELYDRANSEWESSSSDALWELRWHAVACELALIIGEHAYKNRLAGCKNRDMILVEQAVRLFTEHLSEGWNLNRVCMELPVSLSHLRRMFIKHLNANPRDIFEDIRFRRSMELIMVPDIKIETVAFECGYQSVAAFSRAFKNRCYISPSQWQKNPHLRRNAQKKYSDSKWFKEYLKMFSTRDV